jgi:hypothetical protein
MVVPPGPQAAAPRLGHPLLALALLAASAGFVWWISSQKPASMF